ncbi:aminoglycoside phosphotransferase family protein [bacterium]|nr:aminoglycoside phosphotransferase family protein [bacterium]
MAGFAEMNPPPEILSTFSAKFRDLRFSGYQPEQGFSGARVVRLTGDVGQFCLRQWPARCPPVTRILALHQLLRHVFNHGVKQVAVPIVTTNEQTISEWRGRLWQLEPWMPGVADWNDAPSLVRLKNTMRCLAQFHTAARTFACPPNATQWFHCQAAVRSPAVVERWKLLHGWLNGGFDGIQRMIVNDTDQVFSDLATQLVALAREVGPRVLQQLRQAQDLLIEVQPCLRDAWQDHILFTNDEVSGLIDANACRIENVASDLARLLGSLVGDDCVQFATAVDCYSTYHPLSSDERTLIGVLDRSSVVLSGLTWLRRRYGENNSDDIQWERVVQRLFTFRDRLLHLADTI